LRLGVVLGRFEIIHARREVERHLNININWFF
jgi:hypothetical protein